MGVAPKSRVNFKLVGRNPYSQQCVLRSLERTTAKSGSRFAREYVDMQCIRGLFEDILSQSQNSMSTLSITWDTY